MNKCEVLCFETHAMHRLLFWMPSRRNTNAWGLQRPMHQMVAVPPMSGSHYIGLYQHLPYISYKITKLTSVVFSSAVLVCTSICVLTWNRWTSQVSLRPIDMWLKLRISWSTRGNQGFGLKLITATRDMESTTWSLVFLSHNVLVHFQCTTTLNIMKTSMVHDLAQPNPRPFKKKAPKGKIKPLGYEGWAPFKVIHHIELSKGHFYGFGDEM